MTNENIQIKIAATKGEKEKIYRFRYNVYVEEMGKFISQADDSNKILYDDMDDWGINLYATVDSQLAGILRLNIGKAQDFPPPLNKLFSFEKFQALDADKPLISISARLMIDKEYRGSEVLFHLGIEAYRIAREKKNSYNFMLCAPELVGLYEQLGYRRYTRNYMDNETGYRIPMVIILDDFEYFNNIRSPISYIEGLVTNERRTSEWFISQFPEASSFINRRLVNNEDFWVELNTILHQRPEEKISILKNLSVEEAQIVLKQANVLKCQQGDKIIRSGNYDNELYIVLSGAVEVIKTKDEQNYSVTVFGPGDVFGEIAFVSLKKRTADVVALNNAEILVLSQKFFEKFMRKHPGIAARVLLNLSATLCNRLESTTSNWIDLLHCAGNNPK